MTKRKIPAQRHARPSTGDALWKNAQWRADAGLKAYGRVQRWLETSDEAASLRQIAYAVRGRTKDRDAILEKVERKRKGGPGDPPKPRYEPSWMTDVYGFRIVTLFQRDMVEGIRNLLRIVNHDIGENPLVSGSVKEARIFTNRPDHDPLSWTDQIATVIEEFGHLDKVPTDKNGRRRIPEHSQTGYSSVHFTVFTQVEVQTSDHNKQGAPFPLEVQIRSVFEDAWGEIDHKLRYEEKRRKVDQYQLRSLQHWYPHLNALKTYVDGCTQYADLIAAHANGIEATNSTLPPDLTPMETIQDALASLSKLPLGIHKAVRQAYASRERVEAAVLPEAKTELASKMVTEFRALEHNAREFLDSSTPLAQLLLYHVKMEQAFGYLVKAEGQTRRGRSRAIKSAVDIYRDVVRRYSGQPAVYYRLGSALLELDRYHEASRVLHKGMSLLTSISSTNRLRSQLPRVLAYAFWRESEKMRPYQQDQKRRTIGRALRLAQVALAAAAPGSEQEAQARNSLIYYCYDYLRLARKKPKRSKLLELLKELLSEMELRLDVKYSTDLSKLDTLRRVYAFLGDHDRSLIFARRFIAVAKTVGEERLDDVQRENFALARRTVSEHGRFSVDKRRKAGASNSRVH